MQRAHPRVCGENHGKGGKTRLVPGSSPRVRGKLAPHMTHAGKLGLIPACAGKTRAKPPAASASRAHPRVCGENGIVVASFGRVTGSSPRVRGKPGVACRLRGLRGLIPACAGKTWGSLSAARPSRAHPRVCGENFSSFRSNFKRAGSSPRVRGKL